MWPASILTHKYVQLDDICLMDERDVSAGIIQWFLEETAVKNGNWNLMEPRISPECSSCGRVVSSSTRGLKMDGGVSRGVGWWVGVGVWRILGRGWGLGAAAGYERMRVVGVRGAWPGRGCVQVPLRVKTRMKGKQGYTHFFIIIY